MHTTSFKATIKEMSPAEIVAHAEALYALCNCDVLSLTPEEHAELKECADSYYHMTGEHLPTPTFCAIQ